MSVKMTSPCDFGPTKLVRLRELTDELTEDDTANSLFFKLSSDLFCIADNTGYFKKVNETWEMLGWSVNELLTIPFIKLIHPDDIAKTLRVMEDMVENNIIRFYNRYRRKPGTLYGNAEVAGQNSYAVLEWSATSWKNGLTYASARQVPINCLSCPEMMRGDLSVCHKPRH